MNKKYSEMFVASKHPLYLEKIYDRWQELEAKESKPLSPAEQLLAQAQFMVNLEQEQKVIKHEQESIKDRLKAVEGKTDTVSKPKPAGYGSKDDLVLELTQERLELSIGGVGNGVTGDCSPPVATLWARLPTS